MYETLHFNIQENKHQMSENKVSIVIPVYNAEKYLRKCLDSIITQTYKNNEIICVDDGSTDGSRSIVHEYMCRDDRITLLTEEHINAGAARNKGMSTARGEYILFLDSDDVFASDLIEQHIINITNHDADISVCSCLAFDNETGQKYDIPGNCLIESSLPDKEVFSRKDIPDTIFQLTDTWVWDKMYRKSFLKKNNIQFQEQQAINDALFCSLAYAEAERIAPITEKLILHRSNVSTSVEYRRAPHWRCAFSMLEELKNELIKRGYYHELMRSYINLAASRVVNYVLNVTDPKCFVEAFGYCKTRVFTDYEFDKYSSEYYFDSHIYKVLCEMKNMDEIEFLCARRKDLDSWLRITQQMLWDKENLFRSQLELTDILSHNKIWVFPTEEFAPHTKIVLYGYGDIGRDYYEWIKRATELDVVAVLDKDYRKYKNDDVIVIEPEKVMEFDFDYIVIAVFSKTTAENIRESLIDYGVLRNRILWFDPMESIRKSKLFLAKGE